MEEGPYSFLNCIEVPDIGLNWKNWLSLVPLVRSWNKKYNSQRSLMLKKIINFDVIEAIDMNAK